jgi:predicted dithiol-disulfide oxidoreductase (DUF899 family)
MLPVMKARPHARKIRALESALVRSQQKLAAFKRRQPLEHVADYTLAGPRGPVKLSALFGGKRDLIVVHNMGRSCRYCTMWADGFNGLLPHLADRAAFAVVSPDPVVIQKKFAASRGWKFPMYSGENSPFIHDMGFRPKPGEPWPGVSTFCRKRGKIYRVASAPFGPFDAFCATWPLFALLAEGVADWQPKYRY